MPKARQAKPEKDQAATEIAHQQEDQGASVTDSESTIPEENERIEAMAEAIAEVDSVTGDREGVVTHEIRGEEVEPEERPVVDLLDEALAELGEPDGSYPANVVNAIALLQSAQAALQSDGLFIAQEVEITGEIEVELFSPGEVCPTSGLWRPVGSESALSKGDRFPPPSIATGWMLMEAADQKGGKS